MTMALRILLVAALQTAALVYMIVDRAGVLSSATVITLKVKPVDPSDMFRGDYVILNYEISNLETSALAGDDEPYYRGGYAFVTLEQRDGVWTPIAVNASMLSSRAPGTVVLRGQVETVSSNSGGAPPSLRLTYGIESFFVPQGQGKPIEDERQKGDLTAEIAIDNDGRAAIKSLRRTDGTVLSVDGVF